MDGEGYSEVEELLKLGEKGSDSKGSDFEASSRSVAFLLSRQREVKAGEERERDPLGFPWNREQVSYDSAWSAACKSVQAVNAQAFKGEKDSPALLQELLDGSPARRRLKICQESRFQSWSLCEALLAAARSACFDQPSEALELSELAVSVAAELRDSDRSPALLADLKAEAWAVLGNARRVSSDLRGSEKAFELAESLSERGSREPVLMSRIAELKSSLCIDLNQWEEADRLLRLAQRSYRRTGLRHGEGRVLISRAALVGRQEKPAQALALLRQGLERVDAEKEPRLRLVALHNFCYYLAETGDLTEAERFLREARELNDQLGNQLDGIRLRWLEGRLALAAGDDAVAEKAFWETREAFIQQEIGYDAALVSLDLAGVYARQGRAPEMRKLAEEMLPIFQSRDLGREVMAALIVLQNASRLENASAGLIDELSTLLKASREDSDSHLRP
ncbi:MAG: hypothetical protein K0U98_27655 [Deltaproteobacteria bacterium]|nr:hypothetical protein [Deltaproteobacteria bacterium]